MLRVAERKRDWSGAKVVRIGRWECGRVEGTNYLMSPVAAHEEDVVGSAARDRTGCHLGKAPAPAVEHDKLQLVQGVGRFGVPPRLT